MSSPSWHRRQPQKRRRLKFQSRMEALESRLLLSITTVAVTPVNTAENAAFSGPVATFTSPDNGPFLATIEWGDGSPSSTVSGSSIGGGPSPAEFTVNASHTYADEGTDTLKVAITDTSDSTTGSATGTARVAEADTLAVTATPITATEGVSTPGLQVATFTSTNASNVASDFNATILWGDGSSSTGTVAGGDGSFTVTGPSHFYADEGLFSTSVIVSDDPPGTAAATGVGTATVSDSDTLTATGVPTISATEGMTFSGQVASFTDTGYPSNPGNPAGDFSAVVDWGDGSLSQGTVASTGGGSYTVVASHVYADEGTFPVTVTITDDLPGTASASATTSATVAENDTLTAGATVTANATEGATFNGMLATFTETTYAGNLPADFTADINWGDGTTTPGTVTGSAGAFTVSGSHSYAEEGTMTAAIRLSDDGAGIATGTATATVQVADASLSATGTTIAPTEGLSFTGVVANFTDANPNATTADYTATIVWGDGATTTGTVAPNGSGGFQVSGTHAYVEEGAEAITVTIVDDGGSQATASSTANVGDAALTPSAVTITPTEGAAFSGVVATFTDANPGGTVSDFSATVIWGDGQITVATVSAAPIILPLATTSQSLPSSGFIVSSDHTYAEEGTYPIQVVIKDVGGSTATVDSTANVVDAALSATVAAITSPEYTPFSGVVATFSDANPNGTLSDFTSTIDWGDGTTTSGTVATVPTGGFNVSGTHTYAEDGSYNVKVSVVDVGGSTASSTGTATITEPTMVGTAVPVTGFERSSLNNVKLATFTAGNGAEPASGFTATIDWGDGATSAGSVSESGTTYTVAGSHTYFDEGTYPVSVSVNDDPLEVLGHADPSTATISTTAKIAEELLPNGTQGTPNERFIQEVYRDLLHRQVDASALPFWSGLLDAGESRLQVVQAIINAAMPNELGADLVTGMYEKFLGRQPDPGGLAYWVGIVNHNTIEETEAILVGTPEFYQKAGGTNDGFLDRLYTLALGRSPDPSGRAAWDAALAGGATTRQVAEMIFGSHEYHQDEVAGFYQSPSDTNDASAASTPFIDDLDFLDRPGDAEGLENWTSVLDHGATDQAIWANFMATDEFFAKVA